jgi:hypothetical protein
LFHRIHWNISLSFFSSSSLLIKSSSQQKKDDNKEDEESKGDLLVFSLNSGKTSYSAPKNSISFLKTGVFQEENNKFVMCFFFFFFFKK